MLQDIDKFIAMQKIKELSANIAGQLCIPEIDIKNWLNKLFPILLRFHAQYGNKQYVFIISESLFSQEESLLLEINKLWEFISRGVECFSIDLNTRFCLSLFNLDRAEVVDISTCCYDNKVSALYIVGEEVFLYNKEGRSIAFYNFAHPEVGAGRRFGRDSRSYRDYKLLIEEQGEKQLINKIDEIWKDRKKRILIANRKTEKVLQTFLAKWLSDNIYDAKVTAEVGKICGIDRTDIEVTSIETGNNFIIEVKWMGKNASGKTYDIERLKEGIRQVCTYLEREPNAIEGCVVCYDGKSKQESTFDIDKPIGRVDYRVVWLESRSASEIGAGIYD